MNDNFVPIQSLDIEVESRINFNLYVNLPLNKKFILYRKAGGQLESHRLEKLTEGNISNFFIEKSDYQKFVQYVAKRLYSLLSAQDVADNRKAVEKAAKAILSSTLDQTDASIAAAMMKNLKDITGMVIETSLEKLDTRKKKLFHRMLQLSEKGTDFQKHPVNVASLATLITFGIGYSRDQILADVAMGALLHDLGFSRVPAKVATHAHELLNLSVKDREWVYKHPQLAIEILDEKKIEVSELTRMIILQHHEEFNGHGYPAGLRGHMINELAQVLRVADEIDLLFAERSWTSGSLKLRVAELLQRFSDQKVIEPQLLSRIRKVLI